MQRLKSLIGAPLTALVLAGSVLVPSAVRTHAAELWCFDDPVVSVNGHLLDIRVEQPVMNLLTMRSTAVTVVIPQNVSGAVVLNDVSAFPMQTTVARTGAAWNGSGSMPVTIVTKVSAATGYPVQVAATPLLNLATPLAGPTTTSGTANTTITLSMHVGG